MYCTNCGTPISDGAKFCPGCGTALSQEPQPQMEASGPQPEPPFQEAAAPAAGQPWPADAAPDQTADSEPAPNYPETTYQPTQPSDQPTAPSAYPPAAYGVQPAYAGTAACAPPAPKKKTGLVVGICAGGVVVVAAIVLMILWITGMFGGSNASPQAVVERYVALIQSDEVDGQAVLDLIPDRLVQELIVEGEYSSKAELADELADELEEMASYLNYIGYYGGSYQLLVGESTSVSNSTLADIQEDYLEYNINVTAAQEVELVITVSVDGYQMSDTTTIPVVQIGGKWYLDVYSL